MWLSFSCHGFLCRSDLEILPSNGIGDLPAIWCRVRCFPRLVTDLRKSQPSMWYHVLPNRSPISTNTHSVGRVYGDRILYTHYELVWYKKPYIRKREEEKGRFWLKGENQKFYCNTCKIQLWLVRKRLTFSTRTFMWYI